MHRLNNGLRLTLAIAGIAMMSLTGCSHTDTANDKGQPPTSLPPAQMNAQFHQQAQDFAAYRQAHPVGH